MTVCIRFSIISVVWRSMWIYWLAWISKKSSITGRIAERALLNARNYLMFSNDVVKIRLSTSAPTTLGLEGVVVSRSEATPRLFTFQKYSGNLYSWRIYRLEGESSAVRQHPSEDLPLLSPSIAISEWLGFLPFIYVRRALDRSNGRSASKWYAMCSHTRE